MSRATIRIDCWKTQFLYDRWLGAWNTKLFCFQKQPSTFFFLFLIINVLSSPFFQKVWNRRIWPWRAGFFVLFCFLAVPCRMQDLNSPARDRTCVPALGMWSLKLWTTREVPTIFFFSKIIPWFKNCLKTMYWILKVNCFPRN